MITIKYIFVYVIYEFKYWIKNDADNNRPRLNYDYVIGTVLYQRNKVYLN